MNFVNSEWIKNKIHLVYMNERLEAKTKCGINVNSYRDKFGSSCDINLARLNNELCLRCYYK